MKKVLVNEKVSPDALNILKKSAEVVYMPSGDHDEFRKLVRDVTAVMLDTTIKFTPELMDLAPELKVISRTGTGVDNVDIEAATQRGIMVLHTPDANTVTVAEHTVALIGQPPNTFFSSTGDKEREVQDGPQALSSGRPRRKDTRYHRLRQDRKTGCQEMYGPFNMKVLIYDPYIDDSVVAPGVVRCSDETTVTGKPMCLLSMYL
jgi:D-3-phosphoglycerate dehydrogenase